MEAKAYAIEIVQALVDAGYAAYFVGGWVRDYLLGHPSSDIDIATDAPLEKILDLFPNTIRVGLAFGVVIVSFQGHQFEVSTFRKDLLYTNGRKPDTIEFSTPQEDAQRRDFTINGMFYDPLQGVIYDYVGGMEDLKEKLIRSIGNPHERFREDRLRMIRAVRFASRLDFRIDIETQRAIWENADTLFPAVAMERIWQEFTKMVAYPLFERAIIEMHRLGLLPVIFPALQDIHLHTIKERAATFSHFPDKAPSIFYILALFPDHSLEEWLDIGRYLHVSNYDLKLIGLMNEYRILVQQEEDDDKIVEDYKWVYFYSKPLSWLCLESWAARYPKEQQPQFLDKHRQRRQRLSQHIVRIENKAPLIDSSLLRAVGIKPGVLMGRLLREAERLAVEHNYTTSEDVLASLQQSSLWPSTNG